MKTIKIGGKVILMTLTCGVFAVGALISLIFLCAGIGGVSNGMSLKTMWHVLWDTEEKYGEEKDTSGISYLLDCFADIFARKNK